MELFTGWLKTEMVFLPIIMHFYSYDHLLDDILRNKELIHTNSVDISYTEDENKHLCLTLTNFHHVDVTLPFFFDAF